jgi:hypothetical protein
VGAGVGGVRGAGDEVGGGGVGAAARGGGEVGVLGIAGGMGSSSGPAWARAPRGRASRKTIAVRARKARKLSSGMWVAQYQGTGALKMGAPEGGHPFVMAIPLQFLAEREK